MTAAVGGVESAQRATSCPQALFLQDLPAQPESKQGWAGADQSRHLIIPRSVAPLSAKLSCSWRLPPSNTAATVPEEDGVHTCSLGAARRHCALMVQNTGIESCSRDGSSFRPVLGERYLEGVTCATLLYGGLKTPWANQVNTADGMTATTAPTCVSSRLWQEASKACLRAPVH